MLQYAYVRFLAAEVLQDNYFFLVKLQIVEFLSFYLLSYFITSMTHSNRIVKSQTGRELVSMDTSEIKRYELTLNVKF